MAVTVTLAELKARARQRSNMVNSNFVEDDELTNLINESYSTLYDSMVGSNEDYFTLDLDFTLVPGVNTYDVPVDFYKVRGVDRQIGGEKYTLRRYTWSQRSIFEGVNRLANEYFEYRYRLTGNKIYIVPENNVTGTFTLWYVPNFIKLSADTDSFDSVNGWDKYVVLDTAIKMLAKEESDTTTLEREKQLVWASINNILSERDFGEPTKINRVQDKGYRQWGYRGGS